MKTIYLGTDSLHTKQFEAAMREILYHVGVNGNKATIERIVELVESSLFEAAKEELKK